MTKCKYINKLLISLNLLFIPSITFGNAYYFGLDSLYSTVDFTKDYGNNAFSKTAPGINIFAGHMVNEHLGAEIGYEYITKKKKTVTFYTNQTIAGITIVPPTASESYNTLVNYSNHYFGIKAKTNITDNNNACSVLLGIAEFHFKAQHHFFEYTSNAGTVFAEDLTRTFIKNKPVLLIRGSAEHNLFDNFSISATISWKNTSRVSVRSEERGLESPTEIKLKNTISAAIGILFTII